VYGLVPNGSRPGTRAPRCRSNLSKQKGILMNQIIYIVGLVVIVLLILSFVGLR
jgi:hypothetical protein